jgi:hypothetical protein
LVHGITGHNFETRHPSDDSDQVWFPLVKYFQRRRFLKTFTTYDGRTDDERRRRTPSDGNNSHDPLGSGELKTDSLKMSTVKNPTFTYPNYPKICRILLTFSILQYLIGFIFYPYYTYQIISTIVPSSVYLMFLYLNYVLLFSQNNKIEICLYYFRTKILIYCWLSNSFHLWIWFKKK